MGSRLLTGTLIVVAAALSAAASATAIDPEPTVTPRFASGAPGASDSNLNDCTDPANPCTLQRAVNSADPGDDVVAAPGDYAFSSSVDVAKSVTIEGPAGQPRPRLRFSASTEDSVLDVMAAGVTLRHLEIDHADGGGFTIVGGTAASENVVEDVIVRAGGNACAFINNERATIRGTVCWSSGNANGLVMLSAIPTSSYDVRNVTAVATGGTDTTSANALGVAAVQSNSGPGCGAGCSVAVNAVNTIASGRDFDAQAYAETSGADPGTATITLSHSRYDPGHSEEVGNSLVTNAGNNVTAAASFANVAAGDFHQAAGSPTIDAGETNDTQNGTSDPDGDPRTVNGVTDIGADEFVPVPPGNGPGSGEQPAPDLTAPALASASLTNTVFAVDPHGSPETPVAARRHKRGTAFRYTLSEASRVVFTIERARPGRRVRGKCRAPRRTNRHKRRCTRYTLLGRFAQDGLAGANTKRWTGKIGAKRARPGRYRATLVATDPAANVSAPKRLRFRVVPR